jgi:hypothetical protein
VTLTRSSGSSLKQNAFAREKIAHHPKDARPLCP